MNTEYLLKRSEEPSKYHGKCMLMIKDRPVGYRGDKIKSHGKARKGHPKKKTVIFHTPIGYETVPLRTYSILCGYPHIKPRDYTRLTQKSCGDGCAAASQTVQSCGSYHKLPEHVRRYYEIPIIPS